MLLWPCSIDCFSTAAGNFRSTIAGGSGGSGVARKDRVLRFLGLYPLVSNAPQFDDYSRALPTDHHNGPVPMEALPMPLPRKMIAAQAAGKRSNKQKSGKGAGVPVRTSRPATSPFTAAAPATAQAAAAAASWGQQSPGKPYDKVEALKSATLLTRNGDLRIPRSKSALNYYQDSVRKQIRLANPGLGMPGIRKLMIDGWKTLTNEQRQVSFSCLSHLTPFPCAFGRTVSPWLGLSC